jgi:hypothetical protein
VDEHQGALVVVLAGQLELQLELLELLLDAVGEVDDLGAAVLPLGQELVPGVELLLVGQQPPQRLLAPLELAAPLEDRLALLGVVPEA